MKLDLVCLKGERKDQKSRFYWKQKSLDVNIKKKYNIDKKRKEEMASYIILTQSCHAKMG